MLDVIPCTLEDKVNWTSEIEVSVFQSWGHDPMSGYLKFKWGHLMSSN